MNTRTDLDCTLTRLTDATSSLARSLRDIRTDADRALTALSEGRGLSGMGIGTGPLGHQAAADVIKYSAQVQMLLDTANMLGATDEQVLAAYTVADR